MIQKPSTIVDFGWDFPSLEITISLLSVGLQIKKFFSLSEDFLVTHEGNICRKYIRAEAISIMPCWVIQNCFFSKRGFSSSQIVSISISISWTTLWKQLDPALNNILDNEGLSSSSVESCKAQETSLKFMTVITANPGGLVRRVFPFPTPSGKVRNKTAQSILISMLDIMTRSPRPHMSILFLLWWQKVKTEMKILMGLRAAETTVDMTNTMREFLFR